MLFESRKRALQFEVKELRNEFTEWLRQTNPGLPLSKHHSQMVRITRVLDHFLEEVLSKDSANGETEHLLSSLNFAHHIWAYFKNKFALRSVSLIQDALKSIDEFAWECYQPIRQRALELQSIEEERIKEPPLSYFSSNNAPFVQQRDTPFEAEGITSLDAEKFGLALLLLPVPLIGVPWRTSRYAPSTAVVAHEIGHAIEQDFQLTGALDKALANLQEIDDGRREGWHSWRSELFADFFGTLCAGPAYVVALADYLMDAPATVMNEQIDRNKWGRYPIRSLRMEFNFAVLDCLGFENNGLRRAWQDAYPQQTMQDYQDFCTEAGHVAQAFLSTPMPTLGHVPIADVLRTSIDEWMSIKSTADKLLTSKTIAIPRKDEGKKEMLSLLRHYVAAETWACYTDPFTYLESRYSDTFFKILAKAIPSDVLRSGRVDTHPVSAEEADRAIAQKLLEIAQM